MPARRAPPRSWIRGPYAVGSSARTYRTYPAIGAVLPAMGYGEDQLADFEATIRATPCDVVVSATPIDLGWVVASSRPIHRATYELRDVGEPTLADVLAPCIAEWGGSWSSLGL